MFFDNFAQVCAVVTRLPVASSFFIPPTDYKSTNYRWYKYAAVGVLNLIEILSLRARFGAKQSEVAGE